MQNRSRFVAIVSALGIIALSVLALGSPAGAIIGGAPDGNAHPYVGLVRFSDSAGTAHWRCTGTLLTKTVLLTAGHCTDDAASATVWFDASVSPSYSGGTPGTPFTHPGYSALDFSSPDVGVVILNKRVSMKTYGALAPLGLVDELARRQGVASETHAIVGYGLQQVKPARQADLVRYLGTVTLSGSRGVVGVGNDYVAISSNSTPISSGGTCFGDSGGPLFRDDTNVVLGVTSFGVDPNCQGIAAQYRVDVASAREFLGHFVTLP